MVPVAASIDDVAIVDGVEGWLAREEIELLLQHAERVPQERAIVEIGNYRGRSTVALALGARRGGGAKVYSIDPHTEFVGPRGGRFGAHDQEHLYANLARTGVGAGVHVVALPSVQVARSWTTPPIGLLFIDGDHRYEAVCADLDAWRSHLAPGATILFDDCDYADVRRCIDERVARGELVPIGGAGKVGAYRSSGTSITAPSSAR